MASERREGEKYPTGFPTKKHPSGGNPVPTIQYTCLVLGTRWLYTSYLLLKKEKHTYTQEAFLKVVHDTCLLLLAYVRSQEMREREREREREGL